jgi:hypothetical protein
LQKKRDGAGINKAPATGTRGQIFQQASLQYHPGLDSASAEPYFTIPNCSRDTGTYECVSTAKNALRSRYNAGITSQEFHGGEDAGQIADTTPFDGGPGPSVDESNNSGKPNTSYTPPLIVTTPFVGPIPPDDDENNDVTSTTTPSTPFAKAPPKVAQPSTAQPQKTELVKGRTGIAYLPAFQAPPEPRHISSEMSFSSKAVSTPGPESEPKLYPSPPCATGSPNNKYRQVPRSGDAVRKPNHQPYQYQYGGLDQQLLVGTLPSVYNQQQQYPFLQPGVSHSQYNSPAAAFDQNRNFSNQTQYRGSYQHHPSGQNLSARGSYGGGVRGKYDVRKARGGYDKTSQPNRCSNRNPYLNGNRTTGSGVSPNFLLDPALEVNYRNSRQQDNYNDNHGQYANRNNGQNRYQNLRQYTASMHFGYNDGYANEYSSDNSYQHTVPVPLAFNNSSYYYTPSTFAAQEQEIIPHFSPEVGMMAAPPTIAPFALQQQRQPFVPSPYAATFTPRFTDVRNELGEAEQDQAQDNTVIARATSAGSFQSQPGPSMLLHAPGSHAEAMPLGSAANAMSQGPGLGFYERPKPVFAMPPMGEFSPPKARKNRKHARRILEKALGVVVTDTGNDRHVDLDNGNENVDVDAGAIDDLDDGDGEYNPKNEGRKKKNNKNKNKGRKNRRGGNGWSQTDGDKVSEGVEAQGQAVVQTEAQPQVVVEEDEEMSEG